ncbi:MAG: hypothetical protein DWQ31_18505 [Planctomycetota bacterium]|nr:MAG: hypothetical protein DWQ31_18505 [Planctomycetota bacterium]REJ96575.1 MAG: hypothetical protein DWQ35_04305 [Planctomycetota bacterium]
MVIKLRCPEGHPVTCPDEKVGQTGRCPKCGSKFRVPDPRPAAEASNGGNGASADLIVFLCPNGHKLNGPSTLQGKPGQCPHCNARFVIPDFDDLDEDEELDTEDAMPELWADDAEEDEEIEEIDAIEPLPEDASGVSRGDWSRVSPPPAAERAASAPAALSVLFDRFWGYKRRGATLHLHLSNGEVVEPENYAREMSNGEFAVFTTVDDSGKRSMTTIAWTAIVRIAVDDIGDVPDFFR